MTINAVDPDIAMDIYSFIKYEGKVYKGYEAAEILIKNQCVSKVMVNVILMVDQLGKPMHFTIWN